MSEAIATLISVLPRFHVQESMRRFAARFSLSKTNRLLMLYLTAVLLGWLLVMLNFATMQQIMTQIGAACWQMGLIFGLIGLILAVLFAQPYLFRDCDRPQSLLNLWNMISSVTVVVVTMGIFVSIFTMPPVV